jgi:hypothetical protein
MAVNHPTRDQFDATLKRVLVSVRASLDNVTELREFLYSLGANDAAIMAALVSQFSFDEVALGEATNVLNAVNALNQLRLVATGAATVGALDDFFFYAKKVWGINLATR